MAITSRSGLMTMERIQTDQQTNRVLPVQGIGELRKHVTFQMLVTNVSKKPVNSPKNMLTAVGTETAETTIAYATMGSSTETDLTAVHYMKWENR